jgi:hypothetical protein
VRTRVPSATLFLIALVLLLAGCGGGEQQSGNGGDAQKGGEKQAQKGGDGGAANRAGAPVKVALGTIQSVQPDDWTVVLKPSSKMQGGDQMTFHVRKKAEISINDKEAELTDVEAGQQAQIQYVTRKEENRALAVQVVESG